MGVLSKKDLLIRANRLFVTYPSAASSFTPLGYDLRIGLHIALKSSSGGKITEVAGQTSSSSDEYVFPANSANIIVTRERVWLSHHLMGTIHCRGSLALRGLFMTSTTVDPNWDGHMIMRVFNSSPREERLKKDEPFCTMVLHELSRPTGAKPETQPSRVIERLTELYGTQVSEALAAYLNSSEQHREKNVSDELVFHGKAFANKSRTGRLLVSLGRRGVSIIIGWREIVKFILITTFSFGAPILVDWLLNRNGVVLIDPSLWWQGYIGLAISMFGAIYAVPKLFHPKERKGGPEIVASHQA